jgi:hypothetical protein
MNNINAKRLKNTASDGELVTGGYVSAVCVCKFCIRSSGRLECNFQPVALGVRMGWKVSKTLA